MVIVHDKSKVRLLMNHKKRGMDNDDWTILIFTYMQKYCFGETFLYTQKEKYINPAYVRIFYNPNIESSLEQ